MMETILTLDTNARAVTDKNIPISQLIKTGIFDEVTNMKYNIDNNSFEKFGEINKKIVDTCAGLIAQNSTEVQL